MSSIRIYRALCVLALLLLAVPSGASELQGVITSFTSGIPSLPQSLGAELADNLVHELNGSRVSSHRDSHGVYSLVVIDRQHDSEADVSAELDVIAQNRALMKARTHLAFLLGQGGVDRKLFRYDDALGTALLTYYQAQISGRSMSGIQTAAEVIDDYALGLAWLDSRTAEALSDSTPERGTLDDEYCRFLYVNHARSLFTAGKFSEALPVFKNIHDFRWADVDAYLDASECFLRTGQPQECVKLLRELRAELDGKMSSRQLQRAGRLFRESGDKQAAADTLKAARNRLHEEQRRGLQI